MAHFPRTHAGALATVPRVCFGHEPWAMGWRGGDVRGSQLCPCPPAACRLTAVERAATSAEETDIDAVELPLPGAGILDFSRGVTDLDAVGKEASADAKVRGSLRIPVPRGGGFLQHCPAPGAKPSAAALWLGARGAPAERRARHSRAKSVWGRADGHVPLL